MELKITDINNFQPNGARLVARQTGRHSEWRARFCAKCVIIRGIFASRFSQIFPATN